MSEKTILVVDSPVDMANGIASLFRDFSAEVEAVCSGEQAIELLEQRHFDLILSNICVQGMSGMQLLKIIKKRWPRSIVMLMTGCGDVSSAVQAMKLGATNVLSKPFESGALRRAVHNAIEEKCSADEQRDLAVVGQVATTFSSESLVPSLNKALELLRTATEADDGEIFLRESEGGDLLLSACQGPDSDVLRSQTRFEHGIGYPGIVSATGRPILTHTLPADPRYLRSGVVHRGIQSCVCVPLSKQGKAIGSIHLFSRGRSFCLEPAAEMLKRASIPIENAVLAGLAALRHSVDSGFSSREGGLSDEALRKLLLNFLEVSKARQGTLSLLNSHTGLPEKVVSIGSLNLLCEPIKKGLWQGCTYLPRGHSFAPVCRRKNWPEGCQCLPIRVNSPCCLPIMAEKRMLGHIILDFGRRRPLEADSTLVPLMTMAHQLGLRLRAFYAGIPLNDGRISVLIRNDSAPSQQGLELRCLGPFTVLRNGEPITPQAFPRSKSLSLLKLLASRANTPFTRDALIDHLWPGVDHKSGANRLHGVIHALRSVIEPFRNERRWIYLLNRDDLYFFNPDSLPRIDLLLFRKRLAEAAWAHNRGTPQGERIALLEDAVSLYRGDLFEDEPYAEWCDAQRTELREKYIEALKTLAELHSLQGGNERAISLLRQALTGDPLREDLHQALIRTLIGASRRHEALAQLETCVNVIRSELKVEPMPETLRLHQLATDALR